MKQETGKKKSKLWLWLVIAAVALLAVAGVVVALVLGGGEKDNGPKGGRAELYWNIDKKTYTENSESGLSTREPGEDGIFKVRFAIDGEIVEYAVADKQLINYIDTMDAMGLVKDSDGTVVDVINPKDIAKEVNKNAYVKSATANKIVANTSVAMNGMNINVKLEEGITEIYDVTPQAEVPGQKITTADLKAMDTLVIYANDLDQVTHVYVNSHSKESKVYWRADQFYDSTNKTTTREPDENGAYTIPFFCDGEVVELKTKDKAIATKIDSISRWKCHFGFTFDEEGYIIEQYASAIGIQGIMVADCWDVVEIDGDTYTIQRLTTNDGSVWTGTIPAGTIIYEAGVKAKREGRGGQQIDSLQMGDRVTVWTNTTGEVVLVYVAERLVDSPAYWSPTRKYKTADKVSTRKIGDSGYYEIELYKEGSDKLETYYVKDLETISYMDSLTSKIMGLKVLPGNIVEYAYDEQTLTGYTTATRGGVVTTVTGGIFTKMTYGKRGTESNMVLAANARVWNVSQAGKYGEATTVQPGDHLYAVRQPTGEILLAFITKRTTGGEHLYWNTEILWDKTNKTSTREADADGWYHFTMAFQGKLVELKTKDKKLVDKIDGLSIGATALDVSGGVITAVYDAGYPFGGNKIASGYKFQYVTAEGKYYCEYASDATKTVEFTMAEDCVIYNVSSVVDSHVGERIYSIPKNAMLTCFCDIYGEVKVVYVRSQAVKDMYWKTEILYDSTNKVTKRVPDADGYYWYTLAVNGEVKTFKTKSQKIANSMDSYAGAFGLNVKGDEIVGFVSTANVQGVSGNGYTTATVLAIDGRTITVEASGKTETMKLSSDCKIYDVSPVASSFGMKSEIKVGDVIRTYLNTDKSAHCYVYIKARASRVNGEFGYCEHCKKDVQWKPMDGNSAISTSGGHWYVPADLTAWVQSTWANKTKDIEVCLDLNGKILTRAAGGRMFRVAEGDILNIMDSVGGGKVVSGGGEGYNGGLMMMSTGGVVNMYSGTLEFVQGEYKAGLGGNVYMSGAKTAFNLYGGTVTGGISYADGGDDNGCGGNFYLVSGATLNMYGGEISNGKVYGSLKVTVNKKGETVYSTMAPCGGNIYLSESSNANILGGVVKGGEAIRETFTYTDKGVQKTISNLAYGGNIYKVSTNKLNGTLKIENATVSGGKAHRGGNICAYAGSSGGSAGIVILKKATITGGEATQFGGNIMSNCSQWTVTDSVISGGVSASNGGNIYSQGGVYTVKGTTITKGESATGGNIFLYKNKVEENIFTIGEGTVVENGVATGNGGNIYVQKKNYVLLASGDAVDPEENDGTGVPLLPTLRVEGGEIRNGKGTNGANIYASGNFYLTGGKITDGTVSFQGAKEATLAISGGQVADEFIVNQPKAFTIEGAPKLANLQIAKSYKMTVGTMTNGADVKVTAHMESLVFSESFDKAAEYVQAGYFSGYETGSKVGVTEKNELTYILPPPKTATFYCQHCQQDVVFTEWRYGDGSYTKESGHFYLLKDESITSNHRIGASSKDKKENAVDVVLELNGYNIKSSGPVFYVYPYSSLSIQDTKGTSVVSGKGTLRKNSEDVYVPADGGVIYVEGKESHLNIYGGTFTLEKTDKVRNGGVIFGNGYYNIYGGTFNGNTVTENGSAVYFGSSAKAQIYGGTFNGSVYGKSGAVLTLAGDPVIEKVQLNGTDKIVLGELTTGANITVDAEGVFTKPSANAKAIAEAGYFKAANGEKIYVTAGSELHVGKIEGMLTYECPACQKVVDWMPYEPTGTIVGYDAHYYLADDFYQSVGQISLQGEVTLDLHGKTLTGKGKDGETGKRLWRFEGTFNLLDTVGGGKAQAYGLAAGGGALAMCYNKDTGAQPVFNMYGGTLAMTEDCNLGGTGGVLSLSLNAVMNMYGGEIYGGKSSKAEAQNIYIGEATLNMMGGFIDGGIELSKSGAINLSGAAKISGNNGGLWIAEDKLLSLGALESDAEIYVSAAKDAVITETLENTDDYLAYIKPATEDWVVENKDGALYLKNTLAPVEGNKVCEVAAAMDFSNADAEGKVEAVCPVCAKRVVWDFLPVNDSNPGKSMSDLESGHYYLSADLDYTQNTAGYSFSNQQICLNLNGQDLVVPKRAFYTEKTAALNIMGNGTVTGAGELSGTNIRAMMDLITNVNLYGGTYISTSEYPVIENRKSSSGDATVSIYAGTTITNQTGGTAVNLTYKGVLEIYGGTFNGAVTDNSTNKTNITISGAPVIEKLDLTNGAKITVGELSGSAKIKVLADGVFTNDFDNAQNYFNAGYFETIAEDTKLEVQGNALAVVGKQQLGPNDIYEAAKAMDFSNADDEGKVIAECPVCGESVEWNVLPVNVSGASLPMEAGHYYLSEDIDYTANNYLYSFTNKATSCLNLNGQNVTNINTTNKSKGRVFYTESAGTVLNIMGEGTVTGSSYMGTDENVGKSYSVMDFTTNVNFYGGTYVNNGTGAAIGGRKTSSGNGLISIYAGTNIVTNNAEGYAIYVSNNSSLAINGGTVNGKVFDNASKGVTISGEPVIDALDLTNGKKITVGELTSGANITVLANGVFTNAFDNAKAYLDAGYFVSGDAEYKLVAEGNALSMAIAMDPDAVYEAAKVMDFTAGGTVTAQCPACGVEHDWTALPAPTGSSSNQLAAGAYYVAEDMEVTKFWYIANKTAGKVCINLNGKSITNTAERVFYAENQANTLNIMGDGTVTGTGKYNASNVNYVGSALDICTTVNLYGGSWKSTNEYPVIAVRGAKDYSILNIYGGTQIVRTSEDVAGANVYISDFSTVNMYGGVIGGGTAIEHATLSAFGKVGGNVMLKSFNLSGKSDPDYICSFNLYGGIVENGTAEAKGGNIAAVYDGTYQLPKAAINLCGGTVANGSIVALGANASVTVSGDAVVDYVDVVDANLLTVGELTSGASIKVNATKGEAFTNAIAENAENYAQYFTADGEMAAVIVKDNALVIADVCPHCGEEMANIQWKVLEIPADTQLVVSESGHYYLDKDYPNLYKQVGIKGGDVVVDLKGHSIEATTNTRGFYVGDEDIDTACSLSLIDSVGTGSVSSAYTSSGAPLYIITTSKVAGATTNVLNVYGGVYTATAKPGNGACICNSRGEVNIYGGTFNGAQLKNTSSYGGNVYTNGGTTNVYGGTFNAGNAAGAGDCFYVTDYKTTHNGILNVFGGVINGQVLVKGNAEISIQGAPVLDQLELESGVVINLGELEEGADITVKADGAFTTANAKAAKYVEAEYIKAAEGKSISVENNVLHMAAAALLKQLKNIFDL